MILVHTIEDLRKSLRNAKSVTLVPTMGNLHAGHLDLVERARARAEVVVASIFVNRLQFAPHEDFDSYPRTLEQDRAKLESVGCDLIFAPSERDLYPVPQTFKVHPGADVGDILEGEFRPGFFTGVCTVVSKLFNCVQPQLAFFGKKDYQQLSIIKSMVSQMALPIEIVQVQTRREVDGLAMSSRNGYLSDAQRAEAVHLYLALCQMRESFKSGVAKEHVEREALHYLTSRGWRPDYMCIRLARDLSSKPPENYSAGIDFVALAAARVGETRLIDNVEFD